jgi:UrcA family protein
MTAKTTMAAFAALATLGFAAGAHAGQSGPDTVSIKVSVSDLNLSGETGARAALQRIDHAARAICGERPDIRNLGDQSRYGACVSSTTSDAVASMHNPYLAALSGKSAQAETLVAVVP